MRGAAGEVARALEFLDIVEDNALMFSVLSCEGRFMNSFWRFLANCTIFRTPGYCSHLMRLSLENFKIPVSKQIIGVLLVLGYADHYR